MSRSVSRKITVVQLIMALFIVTYHMTIVYNFKVEFISNMEAWLTYKTYIMYDLFAATALGMFFMISGMLHYLSLTPQNLMEKVTKRFTSLAAPFALWNIITVIYYYLSGRLGFYGIKYFILQCSFVPFCGQLWYVFVLILLVILSPVILQAKKLPVAVQLVAMTVLTICCYSYSISYWQAGDTTLHWLERVIRYLPHYFLGVFVAWNGNVILNEKYNKKAVSIISAALLVVILYFKFKYGLGDNNHIQFALNRLLPVVLWFSFYTEKTEKVTVVPLKISFFLYRIHDILIKILEDVYIVMFDNVVFTGVGITRLRFLSVVIVYVTALYTVYGLNRFCPGVYRLLTGGRE